MRLKSVRDHIKSVFDDLAVAATVLFVKGPQMILNDSRHQYTLSTGRMLQANEGILGLDPDRKLTEGYDAYIHPWDYDDSEPLTAEERAEIADAMIARWQAWKESGEACNNAQA